MPGNEVGDKVHNFFAQDNLSQGQHHSQAIDRNWPGLNNNLCAGSQRQIGVPNSSPNNYNIQQSERESGHTIHPLHVRHGLNQSTLRPEFAKSPSQSQQPHLNGYMYGNQVFQTRQGETNFLGVDTGSDQHNLTSRGLSSYESQQGSGPDYQTKTSVRSETNESPVGFDFFGDQEQMSLRQPGRLQSLSRQHVGFNDIQQLQQEAMFRKMQELQRQQQLWQLDARQQNSINQFPSFAKQASGSHSPALINGTPIADASNYPFASELTASNTNWMQRGSPAVPGSSNGLVFSPDQTQAPCVMGLVPQPVDQSLYGVPVSSSRGSPNQYPLMMTDKPPTQQMSTVSNTFPGNQYAVIPDQVGRQDGIFISKHGFQGENLFGQASGQCLSSGINMENLKQVNSLQRNASLQESDGRQELAGPWETLQGKTEMQVASSQNDVALDPTEEKILFGSDDNIWDAFGGSSNMNGGASNLLDGMESGFPSVQSGRWSALMQSAVAESSSDIGIQEERGGLSFQNTEVPTGNVQRNFPPSDDTNMNNNYQTHQSDLGFQINSSQRYVQQSSGGGNKQLNHSPRQNSLTEGSQFYGNSCHSLDAKTNTKILAGPWTPQHSGSNQPRDKPNSWNVPESLSPGGDEVFRIHHNEKPLQHTQKKAMQGEMVCGGDIWKVNSVPSSTVEGSLQENREGFSLNKAAVIPDSSTTKADNQDSQVPSNSNHLPYWKKVDALVKSKVSGEDLGESQHHFNKGNQVLESSLNNFDKEDVKMLEMENYNKKENANDSYHAYSHQTSTGGMRENVLSDARDLRTLPGGKQKSSNQTGRKTSATRKFQYHPMGNLDEDAEPSYGTRQANHSQTLSQQNSRGLKSIDQGQFGQSKFFGQASRTSSEMGKLHDLQGDAKGFVESPSRGIFPGYVPNVSGCVDRTVGINAPNKASQSSQNMLELLQKVDQSRERGTMMHFSSSEHNPSSEMPEAENSEGSVGRLQRSQSSASQGFVLELAPPTQRLPVPNHASYFQSSAQTHNCLSSTHTTPEMREKSHVQLVPMNFVQSLPPSCDTSQGEIRSNRTIIPGQPGSEASMYKMPGNFSSAFSSSFPYAQNQLQNQYMTGASGQTLTNQSINTSFGRNASHFGHRDDSCSRPLTGQSADALPDAAGNLSSDKSASSGKKSHSTHTIHCHESVASPKISVEETLVIPRPFTTPGISQQVPFPKMSPNRWSNPPAQQHSLGALGRKVSSKKSQFHQSKHLKSTSSATQNLGDQDVGKSGNVSSELGTHFVNSQGFDLGEEQLTKESPKWQESSGSIALAQKTSESQWKEAPIKHLTEAPSVDPASSHIDIEAFGRSLKPNSFFHQNYSLLNQMRVIKNAESEPSNRDLKRFTEPDRGLDRHQVARESGQLNECSNIVGDAPVARATPSGDSKMLSFSGPAVHLERNASSQLGNVSSLDVHALGWNNSQNNFRDNNSTAVRVEASQISPQMAPSWFNQYGACKNGQMLPIYDAQRATTIIPFTLGETSSSLPTLNSVEQVNAAVDTNQVGHTLETSTPGTLAIEHFSSAQLLPPDVSSQGLVVLRPKKRKSATSVWHKEVLQGSPSLPTSSMAELDWARAANCLTEKVEDDAEIIEDGPSLLRPKKRLILMTQLMQQLIRPPPAAILSADASSNYESVAYFVARLALGDACSVVSSSRSDSEMSGDGTSCLPGNGKNSQRIDDQYFLNVMEDFMDKVRRLENDFLRLDKRASVLDARVECQDLEKFSVINRFAKFHGRGQADGAEASSSSDAAANVQKLCPQRYVTALPLPRNLPDRVQCLSL